VEETLHGRNEGDEIGSESLRHEERQQEEVEANQRLPTVSIGDGTAMAVPENHHAHNAPAAPMVSHLGLLCI